MREIKFRFWSKVLNNFVIPQDGILVGALKDPKMVALQFTGLKDRNGQDIYDGDIVVKYRDYGAKTKAKLVKWRNGKQYNGWTVAQGSNLEVIGNIYENPELLP